MAKKSASSASPKTASNVRSYVVNPAQLGGIELLSALDGPGYTNRVAWVNTGSGLHYKVVVDRGLDIAEAFYKGMSLSWLSLSGITRPELSINKGLDWLWTFFGGLVTSCGPTFAGAPGKDKDQELSLHGRHSNLPATIESVINPDPWIDRNEMKITGIIREAKIFEPNIELRRTISSPLGGSQIVIEDNFLNRGNTEMEHAWLLHINLGYPLLEPGSELIFHGKIMPIGASGEYFTKRKFWIVPEPLKEHKGAGEACAYVDPTPDAEGMVHCGIVNANRQIAVKISFSKKDYPRFTNWHHFGPNGQFVMGIEPANCGVEGRAKDRNRGWLKFLKPGETKSYRCTIEVLEGKEQIEAFRKLMK